MDDDVDAFERKLSRTSRRNYAVLAAVLLAGASIVGWKLYQSHRKVVARREENAAYEAREEARRREGANTPAERTALATQLDQLAARADAADAAFRTHVRVALDAPPAGTEPCALSLPKLDYAEAATELAPTHFAAAARAAAKAGRDELAKGYFPEALRTPPDLQTDALRYDLVLAVTARVKPTRLGASFTPGSVDGHAVLWDAADQRVICVANDVHARSSSVIDYKATVMTGTATLVATGQMESEIHPEEATSALDADLEQQTLAAIWDRLRAAPH